MLSTAAAFEPDLIRMRTREGMAIARARGCLRGAQPELSSLQRRHLMALHAQGGHGQDELAELFVLARSTSYRRIRREASKPTDRGVEPPRLSRAASPPPAGPPR